MNLNLEAKGIEQEKILSFLQENTTEALAEKINHGVEVKIDGKPLISKKDLNGFIKYACSEAQKACAKGAHSAIIDDTTVYGWALHYFEEDSIQGTLYNPDGTPYNSPKATPKTSGEQPQAKPQKAVQKPQLSLFDMLAETKQESAPDESEEDEIEEDDEEEPESDEAEFDGELLVDRETGEIISEKDTDDEITFDVNAFDKEALCVLSDLFGEDIQLA